MKMGLNHSMVQKIRFILLVCFSLLVSACSDTIDYMVLGAGTPKGNEIAISHIEFDQQWGAVIGIVGCCKREALALSGTHDRPSPKSAYVEWYDYDQKIRYGGTMQLSEKLYDYATDLPDFRWITQNEKQKNTRPYLIFGFGEHGEVVAWISNAASDQNIEGRVMHEVGRIQAEILSSPTGTTSEKDAQALNIISAE